MRWYKCIRCKNLMFGICVADVTIKQFAENGSICPLWEEKTMEIKPCPFCRSNKVYISDSYHCVCCSECEAVGPRGKTDEEGITLWNDAPRKEDDKMEQNCGSCKYNQDGYCTNVPPNKYFQVDSHLCCTDWEAKESKSTPLTPSNSRGLNVNPSENLKYIFQTEPLENRIQQLAEEAAELAQAALKYNRSLGNGCYTPVSRKDAADSLMEEMADVLLCMAAAFPDTERYKDFHVNLNRVYREKETRWAERLKENTKEE